MELRAEDRRDTVAVLQRKKSQTEASVLERGLNTAAETLAAPKLPGARDLEGAFKDLQERFIPQRATIFEGQG